MVTWGVCKDVHEHFPFGSHKTLHSALEQIQCTKLFPPQLCSSKRTGVDPWALYAREVTQGPSLTACPPIVDAVPGQAVGRIGHAVHPIQPEAHINLELKCRAKLRDFEDVCTPRSAAD